MEQSLRKLREALDDRKISSKELTEEYLKKIETENSRINAYVNICSEEALSGASSADERISRGETGPLTGIPMAVKDNICTKDIITTCCSNILKNYNPVYDATAVKRLYLAGSFTLGKTNMDEFAMGQTTENSIFGSTRNPVNTDYCAGGSSGGSAAAVAAGLAPFALGSDTGGSVRQPAAFCGVTGFKPSYGAVSRYGLIAYASSMDQIGVLAQSADDCAIVFNEMLGNDEKDMTSVRPGSAEYGRLASGMKEYFSAVNAEDAAVSLPAGGNGKLRIGIPEELFDDANPECAAAVLSAVKEFEKAGAAAVPVKTDRLKNALYAYYIIACAEASSNLGRYDGIRYGRRVLGTDIGDTVIKTRNAGFSGEVKKRIMLGTFALSHGYYDMYYKKACDLRSRIRAGFDELFDSVDLVITPTVTRTAFKSGEAAALSTAAYAEDRLLVPANLAGLPSLSVPVGKDKAGLPIGMMITGKGFADRLVLSAGRFYQEGGRL